MPTPYQITPHLPPDYTPIASIGSAEAFVALLRSSVAQFAELGVAPPPRSRLHQAMDVLLAPSTGEVGEMRSADDVFRCGMESYRVALEFWTISRAVRPASDQTRRLLRLLQRSFTGKLDPSADDQTSERARDAQFELWLGSWFAMGGRPVQAVEPDLRTTLWFQWYSVAAKRVRSRGQILKRVQHAAKQIRAAGEPGVVAVSLDHYSDRTVESAIGVAPGIEYFQKFEELMEEANAWLLAHAPWVKATLYFGFLSAWPMFSPFASGHQPRASDAPERRTR